MHNVTRAKVGDLMYVDTYSFQYHAVIIGYDKEDRRYEIFDLSKSEIRFIPETAYVARWWQKVA